MDHVQQQLDELTDHCKKTEKHLAEVSARAHRLYNVHYMQNIGKCIDLQQ